MTNDYRQDNFDKIPLIVDKLPLAKYIRQKITIDKIHQAKGLAGAAANHCSYNWETECGDRYVKRSTVDIQIHKHRYIYIVFNTSIKKTIQKNRKKEIKVQL